MKQPLKNFIYSDKFKGCALILFLFAILSFSFGRSFSTPTYSSPEITNERVVEKIVEKPTDPMDFSLYKFANNERKKKMVWNPCLANKAEVRAKQIFDTGLFSHTDRNGRFPAWDFIEKCSGFTGYKGENLTQFYTDPTLAHTALMNSPTHKANILGDYTDMGVGCFENVCVEFFAK